MKLWILVVYLAGSSMTVNNGGPATAEFVTREACEAAGAAIAEKWPGGTWGNWTPRYQGHLCVHASSPTAAAQ